MTDHSALIAEAEENVPRELGDWANLAMRLLSAVKELNSAGCCMEASVEASQGADT